ncbi:MAG: type II secretion system protein [Clostridia bacterium]|nr:type II secretion system protein [Clostridia bacterium]
MNLSQRMKRSKKSKKGFTLVELVVVIAVLGVLAAVAIPVITSTIRSAKISVMQSNCGTLNMLVKEAINNSKINMKAVRYNDKDIYHATIYDVCKENEMPVDEEGFFAQEIRGDKYEIVWTSKHNIALQGPGLDDTGTPITGEEFISDLEPPSWQRGND